MRFMGRVSSSRRREEIQKKRPTDESIVGRMLRPHHHIALVIALGFVLATTAILMLRPQVVGWRVGQYAPHDIVARVNFDYLDPEKQNMAKQIARVSEPRV